jgi:hypothetical protein
VATCTQPTTHLSSAGTSTSLATGAEDSEDEDTAGRVDESDICEDCTGIRYCAYDHSDSKYFGRGIKGASGEKVDCRFLCL